MFLSRDDRYIQAAPLTGARPFGVRPGNRMLLGGFDQVFDVVGTASTLHDGLRWARAGSTVVLVGANLRRMTLDLTPVWYQEADLVGSVGHDVVTFEAHRSLRLSWR